MSAEHVATGRPTWIEASAGTGKTWTLERLVVRRIEEGAAIDAILVVTFTDKATREMRGRIRRTIEARWRELAADDAPGAVERRARLRAALFDFDRATIATLHGFCRRTLREHAFLGGRALEEDHEGGRALDRTLTRAWLARQLEAPGPLRAALEAALAAQRPDDLVELLEGLVKERSPMRPAFSLAALDEALAALPTGAALPAALIDLVEHAGADAGARARLASLLTTLDRARDLPEPEARLAALLAWGGGLDESPSAWLAARLAPHPALGPALRTIARSLATPVPALAALAAPALREALAEGKARAEVVDFDELVLGMRRALEGPRGPELVALVRARYQHVVVDEFQDTDPDQWAIVRALFFDCAPQRSLVLIGDPKQAIYGFRGADVHTYLRAEEEVCAAGDKLRLDTSYRASPPLLDALHRILLPAEGEPPFFTRASIYEAPVKAGDPRRRTVERQGEDALPLAPITVLSVRGEAPLRPRAARRTLSRAIADEIRTLLGREVLVGSGDTLRRLGPSDIFVLTRSAAEGLEVADALGRAGVPHAFFKQEGLFATAEARDWADLLLALATPDDPRRLARALATPFFGVAPEDFGALAALPEGHRLLVRFRTLAALAESTGTAELLSTVLEATGITCRELYLFRSERRLTNYLHLAEVLADLARTHDANLRELGSRLVQLSAGELGASEGEDVQRLPSERAAVQLLTMHKAKGLEAEVVFLYGGMGRPRTRRWAKRLGTTGHGERIAWLLPPAQGTDDPAIEASIVREDREEAERLLYVALTRARSLLYLPFFEAAGRDGLRGAYRVVHARLDALGRAHELVPPLFRVEPITPGSAGRAANRRREPLAAPEPHLVAAERSLPAAAAFEALGRARSGGVVTSYSRMKRERDRTSGAEFDVLARFDEVSAPRSESRSDDPSGAAFGVAVHAVLERVPLERVRQSTGGDALLAHPDVRDLALDTLIAGGLDERALPLLGRLVHGGLTTPLPALGAGVRLLDPPRRAAEVPFVHVLPEHDHPGPVEPLAPDLLLDAPRGYLGGVLDLVLDVDGRRWVIDWKTDRLPAYDPASVAAHAAEHYGLQLRLYALALRRMLVAERAEDVDARLGGVVYVFLRGRADAADGTPAAADDGLFVARPTAAELDAWDRELRRSAAPFGYPLGLPLARAGKRRERALLGPRLDDPEGR